MTRQAEAKTRTVRLAGFVPRLAPVGGGESAHDRQAETGAGPGARRGLGATELLEQLRDELGRDALALVAHLELDPLLGHVDADRHGRVAVLERVGEVV